MTAKKLGKATAAVALLVGLVCVGALYRSMTDARIETSDNRELSDAADLESRIAKLESNVAAIAHNCECSLVPPPPQPSKVIFEKAERLRINHNQKLGEVRLHGWVRITADITLDKASGSAYTNICMVGDRRDGQKLLASLWQAPYGQHIFGQGHFLSHKITSRKLTLNEPHTVVFEIAPTYMELWVDGELHDEFKSASVFWADKLDDFPSSVYITSWNPPTPGWTENFKLETGAA